ncbi:aldehyde dehydrogenase family protein [Streptomyces scabiei]|uniref:aldehyde dehydrogenase family protein n=1 Tax=Streptomyces TaxID=1883 RepID=UPI000D148F9B
MIARGQAELVPFVVPRGRRKLARYFLGGGRGLWDAAREARLIPPTLLIDVPDDAEITREEIFGPV